MNDPTVPEATDDSPWYSTADDTPAMRAAKRAVVRTLFHDERAEQWLLGGLILAPSRVGAVAQILRDSEDLVEPRHRVIYEAILRMVRTGRAGRVNDAGGSIDFLELVDAIRHVPLQRFPGDTETVSRLNTIGGAQYLGDLTTGIVTAAHVETHTKLLASLAARRRELELNARAHGHLLNPDLAPDLAVEMAREEYLRGFRSTAPTRGHSMTNAVERAVSRIEMAAQEKSPMVTTGFPSLDGTANQEAILGGFSSGQYITLAAVTGSGKTTFALQIVKHVAGRHGRVLFFAQEADRDELATKMACGIAGVDFNRAREAKLDKDEWAQLERAFGVVNQLDVVWYDSGTITSADVRMYAQLEAMRAEAEGRRVVLAVVDYLQILTRTADQKKLGRPDQIEEMSMDVREAGKTTGIPMLVLSQFNRVGAKEGKPTIHDLKGSGAIENDSHVVILLYGEGTPDPRTHRFPTTLCDVQKNRATGITRAFPMRYERRFDRFVDIEAEKFLDGFLGAAPEGAEAGDTDTRFKNDTDTDAMEGLL